MTTTILTQVSDEQTVSSTLYPTAERAMAAGEKEATRFTRMGSPCRCVGVLVQTVTTYSADVDCGKLRGHVPMTTTSYSPVLQST